MNVRVFTVGAYSNLNTNRIEPPIDDFVYLTIKYMAWAINPVRKTLREAYDLKVKYVDDRVREVTQNLQSNLKWLPSLGIGASYRTLGSTLSMLVSDVDYLVRRFNPNVARSAAVEVELEAVSKGSTFDKKELNKDF